MTRIFDAPDQFAATALDGFCRLYPDHVQRVNGGALRSAETRQQKVALVIGGGSGHYPAFLGFVGPGLADASVAGDVFASPSTQAVARIGRLAHRGMGVVLGFGNYAGDVLNFGAAAERLRAEGIDARILAVTDDVASADASEQEKRRGVAGDVVVFKVAGAAAERGDAMDEVMRLAAHANRRTASFGVAFSGCTLPGAREPLFTVPKGRIGVGLGIHGEPGVDEVDAMSASELAALLVDKLLPEAPAGWNRRACAILNGLGSTKYEELFVLWTHVEDRLKAAGITLVRPEAGELVTSLDMAGCSLTLGFLDDELEPLWLAPCDTPFLRRGAALASRAAAVVGNDPDPAPAVPPASDASRRSAACILALLRDTAALLVESEEELGRIDAFAGDGDHGQGMRRGSAAALEAAEAAASAGAGARTLLGTAADAWADRAGGTSGAIWGLLLRGWSDKLSDDEAVSDAMVAAGVREAVDRVMRLGRARPGDKTLVDALVPFADTLAGGIEAGRPLAEAWKQAAEAATRAAEATAPMTPRLGRARPLASRSVGHPDAGAVSLAMIARRLAERLPDAAR
ncbi:dihydroxyacetone kinase family protein [Aureimonas jatrophae]|uniref:Homodimeric dihydroxyacetone kinase n=1 Tax=Aureimonas jatrophae TaxID=1166073 RepID=A0A1H0LXJ2_9HYPH|nr:dihydroxyacetone kinase family protein [Aureimonas jatrophae]MBB3952784.1 dihydroxyacetone kinase [Aureimonas jatrophae]SDO72660.1 homodimeric dihydroxyacetone kinase [Aureimonas jatrophae]